jgi:L,D-transpeptidase YcbB
MKYRWATKSKPLLLVTIGCLVSAAAALGSQVAAAADALSEFAATLRQIAAAGQLSDLRWSDCSDYRIHITNFYNAANYAPAWLNNDEPTQQAKTLIDVLKQADTKGLNTEDYDSSRRADRLARLRQSPSPADLAHFDCRLDGLRNALPFGFAYWKS